MLPMRGNDNNYGSEVIKVIKNESKNTSLNFEGKIH